MDASRFDALAMSLSSRLTRRVGLGLLGALGVGARVDLAGIDAKKKKKKKKKKKCKHPPCGGPCTVSGGAFSLVTESKFNKKPLRLRQTVDLEGGGSQTEVTLGANSVLRIAYAVAEPGVITTVTYGGAFAGIGQAQFATDGVTITGTIAGRAIVPLPVGAGPSQVTFADGGPPLSVQGDAKLAQAIQGLFAKAAQQANTCQPVQQQSRSASTENHSSSFDCITKQAKCGIDAVECERAVVDAAAACSIVPLFGTIVCAVVGTGYCVHKAATCAREAKYSPTCCPVRCGGDVGDLFGSDPLCCEPSDTCLNPNSNQSGGCCAAGTTGCGGKCCPPTSCASGTCCTLPNGTPQLACGGQCCAPFSPCCGGTCCSGTCIGNACCQSPNFPCGGICCQTRCCNNVCCAPGQICSNNQCITPDPCPGANLCGGQCCPQGRICCLTVNPNVCCPQDQVCCGGQGCVDICLH
jgi:hypothetical protein